MHRAMAEIRSGNFAAEWRREQETGYELFSRPRAEADRHALNQAEAAVRQIIMFGPQEVGETEAGAPAKEPT